MHSYRDEYISRFFSTNTLFGEMKSQIKDIDNVGLQKPDCHENEFKVSLCIPSSAISSSNAANLEHVTHIGYQIAKAATTYRVSEIIILHVPKEKAYKTPSDTQSTEIMMKGKIGNTKRIFDSANEHEAQILPNEQHGHRKERRETTKTFPHDFDNNSILLATLLQYFVTPKYLVGSLFKTNPYIRKLKYAQKLPKLSTLPFMNSNGAEKQFKEGLTTAKKTPKIQKKNKRVSALRKLKVTKYVNIGQQKLLELTGAEVPVNVRVTVDIKNKTVVSPQEAYGVSGSNSTFGYHVRLAHSISAIFTESSEPEGYSESIFVQAQNYFKQDSTCALPSAERKHTGQVLLVIGKYSDLNEVLSGEKIEGVEDVSEMFDSKIEVPNGLRVEDAALVSLAKLR